MDSTVPCSGASDWGKGKQQLLMVQSTARGQQKKNYQLNQAVYSILLQMYKGRLMRSDSTLKHDFSHAEARSLA